MTTKERISYEALVLFAKKGYKGTSVKDIADAVGIKDSSLYKHYKSKQEILDTIILNIKHRITEMSQEFGLPMGDDYEEAAAYYGKLDEDGIIKFSQKIFLFYLKDDMLSKFWRMGCMEQFQNNEVYTLFRQFFFDESIQYLTRLFSELIQHEIFVGGDPGVMAMYFYTPIFFLLSKYAGEVGKEEEALQILGRQVEEFSRIYKKRD